MIQGYKKLITLLSVLGMFLIPNISMAVEFTQCSSDGYTISTINGIFTDKNGAQANMIALQKTFGFNWRDENVDYQYLLNPSHLAGAGDLIKSIQQKLFDSWAVKDYDLIEMIKDASERVKTQKLLLVAHSQGNFYANSFYDSVAGKKGGVPIESIGVYGVANPASRVAGGGKWLTSDTDKAIAKWVSNLTLGTITKPNAHIEYKESDDKWGHDFSNVYLRYEGDRMVSEIKKSLDKLSENDTQGTEGPCIDKPDLGLIGNVKQSAKGVAFFVLDPTANLVRAGAVGTYGIASDIVYTTGGLAYDAYNAAATVAHKAGVIAYDITDSTVSGIKSGATLIVSGTKSSATYVSNLFKKVFAKKDGVRVTSLSADVLDAVSTDNTLSQQSSAESELKVPESETPEQNVQETQSIEAVKSVPIAIIEFDANIERAKKIAEIQEKLLVLEAQVNEIVRREANGEIVITADGTIVEVIASTSDVTPKVEYPNIAVSTGDSGNSSISYSPSGNGGGSSSQAVDYSEGNDSDSIAETDEQEGTTLNDENLQNEEESTEEQSEEENNTETENTEEQTNSETEENNTESNVSPANHLVISELQVSGFNNGDEFIEIYNPTSSEVSLGGWSIQYIGGTAEAFPDVTVSSKQFDSGSVIKSKGFFLIVRGLNNAEGAYQTRLSFCRDDEECKFSPDTDGYLGSVSPDMFHRTLPNLSGTTNGGNIFLVSNSEKITTLDDTDIVDTVSYGNPKLVGVSKAVLPGGSQSIERRVVLNNICVSPTGDAELLGNSCDTDDNAVDFELRVLPNPQNSFSALEPLPVIQPSALAEIENFAINYDKEKLELVFSWIPLAEETTHKIFDSEGELIFETTTESSYRLRIYEVGRDYDFSIKALDSDGVELASTTGSISVPTFINNIHFYSAEYKNLYDNSAVTPLVEFSYDEYPFLPLDLVFTSQNGPQTGPNHKVAVFYLNKDAPQREFLHGAVPLDEDITDVLRLKFKSCGGSDGFKLSLLFPDSAEKCRIVGGGFPSGSLSYPIYLADADNHFVFPVHRSDTNNETPFSPNDYFTVAFYGFYRTYPQGSDSSFAFNNFKLLAVDKTHYLFNEGAVSHQNPSPPTNMQFSVDLDKSILTVSWDGATDPDSIDEYLRHEISYDDGQTWKEAYLSDDSIVEAGVNYSAQVRAIDDFGLKSDVLTGTFTVPAMSYPKFGLSNLQWGNIDGTTSLSFDYPKYPFIPIPDGESLYNYDIIVFYLNRLPPMRYEFNAVTDSSYSQVGVSYQSCSSLADRMKLILYRLDLETCSGTLLKSSLYPLPDPDGGNITLPIQRLYNIDKTVPELTSSDYITIGFYKIDGMRATANDTHRYYFKE